MSFEFMPGLDWSLGWPAASITVVLSGLATYLFLKYKDCLYGFPASGDR